MLLKDFNFGFADASKEYLYIKDLFDRGFHDPNKNVEKLLEGPKYMIVGRKGVGKTALLSKIKFLTENNTNSHSEVMSLSSLEYNTFKKTKIDKDVLGSNKYKSSWEFILLISIVKQLFKNEVVENDKFLNLITFIESIGIDVSDTKIKRDVTFLNKLKMGANLHVIKAEIEKDFNESADDFSYNLNYLNEKIKYTLEQIYLPDYKLYLLIDGLDDVLRYRVDQHEIIKSLIRSIDELNLFFYDLDINIKVILSIREDILTELSDPDMNKIKRDGSINVDWSSKQNDLIDLVKKRLVFSGLDEYEAQEYLDNIFNKKMRRTDTWSYIFDRTLFKPRDILQFFIICQEIYPDNDKISPGELKDAIKRYSNDYLIEEMKDELSGFIKEDYIQTLPEVFKQIGNKDFKKDDFKKYFDDVGKSNQLSESDVNMILTSLYSSGYIGQLIRTKSHQGSRTSVQFKYRNPSARLDFRNDFIIHYGIKAGLGIAL